MKPYQNWIENKPFLPNGSLKFTDWDEPGLTSLITNLPALDEARPTVENESSPITKNGNTSHLPPVALIVVSSPAAAPSRCLS